MFVRVFEHLYLARWLFLKTTVINCHYALLSWIFKIPLPVRQAVENIISVIQRPERGRNLSESHRRPGLPQSLEVYCAREAVAF